MKEKKRTAGKGRTNIETYKKRTDNNEQKGKGRKRKEGRKEGREGGREGGKETSKENGKKGK